MIAVKSLKYTLTSKKSGKNACRYYPFGMTMPGRTYTATGLSSYPFGFNGKLKDDEVYGEGNTYDFGARIHDARIGRWLSVDPLQKKYPSMSPYNYSANNPIYYIDPDGRELKPNGEFLASRYGALYKSLLKTNTAYNIILSKFKPKGPFNVNYSVGILQGANGGTGGRTTWQGNKLIAYESNQLFNINYTTTIVSNGIKYTYERTDFSLVRTLIHEALHSHIRGNGIRATDDEHSLFNNYRQKLIEGLNEYNKDHELGYTAEQIADFAWAGTTSSKQFKMYMKLSKVF